MTIMKNSLKGKVIKILAVIICIMAPFTTALSFLPVWIERSSEATVSGLMLMIGAFFCLIFSKSLKPLLKIFPFWAIGIALFVALAILSNVIKEMVVIAFAIMVSNIIGCGLYKIGKYVENKPDKSS